MRGHFQRLAQANPLGGERHTLEAAGGVQKRAAELLRICRDRITAAKVEVTQIVAELEPDATGEG